MAIIKITVLGFMSKANAVTVPKQKLRNLEN